MAFNEVMRKASPIARNPNAPEKEAKTDEFIKKNLVQINVEGIDGVYFDNLSEYFKALKEKTDAQTLNLDSMDPDEAERVMKADAALPKKGWVFEIRGYTFHWNEDRFVADTLLENLRKPEGVFNVLSPPMKQKIKDRIGYFWVTGKKDAKPEANNFALIKQCFILTLMQDDKGKGGKGIGPASPGPGKAADAAASDGKPAAKAESKRSSWKPIGEVAHGVFGNATGGAAGFGGGGFGGRLRWVRRQQTDARDESSLRFSNRMRRVATMPGSRRSFASRVPSSSFCSSGRSRRWRRALQVRRSRARGRFQTASQ